MRISDWSSDVCSSDLPDATIVSDVNGAVTLSNAAAAKLFDELSASPDDRLSLPHILKPFRNAKNRAPIVVPQGVSGDQLDFEATTEIGRASCRERVCQYV